LKQFLTAFLGCLGSDSTSYKFLPKLALSWDIVNVQLGASLVNADRTKSYEHCEHKVAMSLFTGKFLWLRFRKPSSDENTCDGIEVEKRKRSELESKFEINRVVEATQRSGWPLIVFGRELKVLL